MVLVMKVDDPIQGAILQKLTVASSRPFVGMSKTGDCRQMNLLTSKKSGHSLSCQAYSIMPVML